MTPPMYATITSCGTEGYRCTSRSGALDNSTVALLERVALPFGNGWHRYIGARSIKGFPIDQTNMALTYTQVTGSRDDHGRPGVLLCKAAIVNVLDYAVLLSLPGFGFDDIFRHPPNVAELLAGAARDLLEPGKRERQFDSDANPSTLVSDAKSLLFLGIRRKVILAEHYVSPRQWTAVEQGMRSFVVRLPITLIRRISFATMTLSLADPMKIIAMPQG